MKKKKTDSPVVIYSPEGKKSEVQVRVDLEKETLWLTQKELAQLFKVNVPAISKHLRNIFDSKELRPSSVISKMEITAKDGKNYQTTLYSLDAIIAVGYRVNSRQATKFRIWATKTLKDYLVNGYAINQKRLKERTDRLRDIEKTMSFMQGLIQDRQLNADEAEGLLHIITDYSYALSTLDAYDHKTLIIEKVSSKKGQVINCEKALQVIARLKKDLIRKGQATELFGKERQSGQFESSLSTIYQTFGGKDLYPSLEEKAANLLYLIVKNHPFVDGNKRTGAFLFIWFLDLNKILYAKDGSKRIADNALISLALLVAESKSQDKDIVISLIVNLINKRNK